jgi:hypothetical protein
MNDIDTEIAEDNQYITDLSDFVKSLPPLTNEQIAEYDAKMVYLESIHNEIRLKNPLFMPVYDPSADRDEPAGTKYMDIVYDLGTIEKG